MSIDLNLPALMQIQMPGTFATLDQTPQGGVIAGMNEGAVSVGVTEAPDGEHAARLRSQALLPPSRMESGLTAMALHSANLLAMTGAGRAEAGGMAGQSEVANLNAVPAVVTALHTASANMPQRKLVQDRAIPRKEADTSRHAGAEEQEQPDEEEPSLAGNNEAETGSGAETAAEPCQGNQYDALYTEVHEALMHNEQHDMLRQLQDRRRVVMISPATPVKYGRECDAWACLVWRSAAGVEHAVALPARLWWPAFCGGTWVTVRGYRERAAGGCWQLRVQPLSPARSCILIRTGISAPLLEEDEGIRIDIPDASSFWSALSGQFSVQVAISAIPFVTLNRTADE